MFLLEGCPAPDHPTFARFRRIHFAPCAKNILAQTTGMLLDVGEISGETLFIDGIKIESCANKYTFVWKKAVTKNLEKLLLKLAAFVQECEELYAIKVVYSNQVRMKHLKKLRKKLYALKESEGIPFVHGSGKRKNPLQKSIETLEEYLRFKYAKIIADAGYESEENDLFLEENGQLSFIKPSNYEISKTRKFQKDISRMENMEYHADEDHYICRNQKKRKPTGIKREKSKTGYVSEKTIYICEDCSGCPYKQDCIQGNNCKTPLEEWTKHLNVSKVFKQKREEDLERILTEEGCELRINRSIQVEGAFGELKQDRGFRRFLSRGTQNVLAESILLAVSHNINELHNKI